MSYNEAIQDGIRMTKSTCETNYYFPKCYICGVETPSMNYIRGYKYKCAKCREQLILEDKQDRAVELMPVKDAKLQKAIKRISKVCKNNQLTEYNDSIEKVQKCLHKDRWFQSTEEIMVALELLRHGYKPYHQVEIGRYKADFVIKELKVVLEVDGTPFHTEETLNREIIRDDVICMTLGNDWEVIRIKDKLINQNVRKLIPAITKIKEKRANVRKANGGSLPAWYSDH